MLKDHATHNANPRRPVPPERTGRPRRARFAGVAAFAVAAGLLAVPATSPIVAHADSVPSFRVLDTRTLQSAPLSSGSTTCRKVAGLNGVPSNAEAVTVNITAVRTAGNGYVKAYGLDKPRPSTSSLNFTGRNDVRANNALVEVGRSGYICLYNVGSTHLVLDVTGHFSRTDYVAITPRRLGDTRTASFTTPTAGQTRCFKTSGAVPSDANGVFVNVSAVRTKANAFLKVHGRDRARPATSTMNYRAGVNSAIGTVAQLGKNGDICVWVSGKTDVIMDLVGYFKAESSFDMLRKPFRALDTRNTGRLGNNGRTCFELAGRRGVLWGTSQVFATVALVNPSNTAYAVTYPKGFPIPSTSTVNAPARQNRSNGTWLTIGVDGSACVKVSRASDVVVDVWGVVHASPSGGPAFTHGALAFRRPSSNTSWCNYQPGGGPFIRQGTHDPEDWIYSAKKIGTLPIGGAAKSHYYKLFSHTEFIEYENCINNRRVIERFHRGVTTACGRITFPDSFPVGLPSLWTYHARWTTSYTGLDDYRPCPNV